MKSKTTRIMQALRGPEAPSLQRSPNQATGLYLLELRARVAQSDLPKHKITVKFDASRFAEGRPKSVKISLA